MIVTYPVPLPTATPDWVIVNASWAISFCRMESSRSKIQPRQHDLRVLAVMPMPSMTKAVCWI